MPPFSVAANGALPNSTNELWPEKPCQPKVVTEGGSMRPVEGLVPLRSLQSASLQYTAPGTRWAAGRWPAADSSVLAKFAAMAELPPPGVPSGGPPASYTTCTPVCLKRVVSASTTYQLNSGNTSLHPAKPFRSVLLKFE